MGKLAWVPEDLSSLEQGIVSFIVCFCSTLLCSRISASIVYKCINSITIYYYYEVKM